MKIVESKCSPALTLIVKTGARVNQSTCFGGLIASAAWLPSGCVAFWLDSLLFVTTIYHVAFVRGFRLFTQALRTNPVGGTPARLCQEHSLSLLFLCKSLRENNDIKIEMTFLYFNLFWLTLYQHIFFYLYFPMSVNKLFVMTVPWKCSTNIKIWYMI